MKEYNSNSSRLTQAMTTLSRTYVKNSEIYHTRVISKKGEIITSAFADVICYDSVYCDESSLYYLYIYIIIENNKNSLRFKKVSGKLDHHQQHENKEQNYEEHDEDVALKCDDDEHNKYTDSKYQGRSTADNDDVDQCYEDIYIDYNFVAELLSFIYEVE